MLKEFAIKKKADYMMVSARKNNNIDELFQRLGDRLIQQKPLVSKRSLSLNIAISDHRNAN